MKSCFFTLAVVAVLAPATATAGMLRGEIRDEASGELVAARLYLQSDQGEWFFAKSSAADGKAVPYKRVRGESAEIHTALSAHPFEAELPPGTYTVTVEKGKEYIPHDAQVTIGDEPVQLNVRLRRLVNMADRGWYSGDTHVHRTLDELPTAMLADDLNVAFPLTYWVTKSDTPPSQGDKNQPAVEPKLIEVTRHNVIWPLNTEYEIFTVGQKRHTLGAVFGLGHRTVLERGVPPVRPIAEQVHAEGGLLDIDKHNWPWSMMLVPVMQPDLFELANNHHWRTQFAFRTFGEPIPKYMKLPSDATGFDEKAWTEFGFQNYYALLNCGFRMMPTAGTASGVHPVPLGWGRVYVHCAEGFSYEAWMKGLKEGRSFVTTGPLLVVRVTGPPDDDFRQKSDETVLYTIHAEAWSQRRGPVQIQVLQGGEVVSQTESDPATGGLTLQMPVAKESTWFAVRCYETLPDGRQRFAHSAPVWIDVEGRPIRPRKAEVEYLLSRVQGEIDRNKSVLSAEAMREFQEALSRYQKLAETAK